VRTPGRSTPYLSVVIPVYNEQENLPTLYQSLSQVLKQLGKTYEIILVDDGSSDRSWRSSKGFRRLIPTLQWSNLTAILVSTPLSLPDSIRRGGRSSLRWMRIYKTPGSDPALVQKIEEGFDVWEGGARTARIRRSGAWRLGSSTVWCPGAPGIRLRDYGCMLRAYRREIVQQICKCDEISSFIPALATPSPARSQKSKSRTATATRAVQIFIPTLDSLEFDLMTGFSLLPIQAISAFGLFVRGSGCGFSLFLSFGG